MEDATGLAQTLIENYTPFLWDVAKAILFLIVGFWVAGLVRRIIRKRVIASERLDDTLGLFFSSIAFYLIMIVVIIAVLQLFGFQATSLVAVLGAATLAIGLALQGTLSHVAAGVMLVIFRPYKLGQFVEIGGEGGTVEEVNLFFTELTTPQNVKIVVPNGDAWGSTIANYSHHSKRRLDVTFGIDYSDDIDKATDIILEEVRKDGRGHAEPEPWARVVTLNDSSVDIQLRVWCLGSDYWEFKFALLKNVKEAFDAGGISIPYPHQVEIHKEA
ncbi:MAG: mechanosensitive ion channel domain-containing protein [Hyphomicrobiales bacterium]